MVIDLRMANIFEVSKDVFFDPQFDRRKRAVYIALCFFIKVGIEFSIPRLSKASGYSEQVVGRTLRELEMIGYIKRSRKSIDILK